MRSRQRATCESDIRLTRHDRDVRIVVEHQGEELNFESEDPVTINEVLDNLGIPPSTVLAVHGEAIVPHTSTIKDDLRLELVVVSSGG